MPRMKSWESPRRGRRRNNKSKAATARLRQLKKRNQRLRNKLKASASSARPSHQKHPQGPIPEGVFLSAMLSKQSHPIKRHASYKVATRQG